MQVRRSLVITFLNSNANTILMFGVSLVLARLLTPSQIGAFSIGAVIINIAAVFRDIGAPTYLVQKPQLEERDAGAVLGITLTTSWFLATLLWFAAPQLAIYFGQADLVGILHILTISFLLVPLAGVMSAVLMRSLNASRNAVVSTVGTIAFCCTALAAASAGFGAETLAWANLANVLATVCGFWLVRRKDIRLRPSLHGWSPFIRFGGGVMINNLANVANQSIPDLAIGRYAGAHEVGVYSRANGLVSLFQQAIGPALSYTVMPVIAHNGHRNSEVTELLARSASHLTVLCWPVFAFTAIFAKQIIDVLYGPQWNEAASLVALLCAAAAVKAPFMLVNFALLAWNRPYAAAGAAASGLATRLVLILLIGNSSLFGLALLLCVGDVVATLFTAFSARRHLGLGFRMTAAAQGRSALVTSVCFVACISLKAGLEHQFSSWQMLVIAGLALMLVWLSCLFVLRHPFCAELTRVAARAPAH